MATFGKRSSDRPGGSGDLFLKNFKQPRTLIWWLDPNHPQDWVEYKQHFDNNAKRSWPCAIHEGANNCVGCEFPVTDETNENDPGMRVRKTSSKWVVPVISEKGYVELYQLGYVLWKSLKELCDEYGTLTDAWYAVRRSGESFNDITYTATKTDDRKKPQVKAAVPDAEYVSNLLGKQYVEAMERYGYDPDGIDTVPDPDPVSTGDTAKDAITNAKAKAAARGHAPVETPKSEDQGPEGHENPPEAIDPAEAGIGELKDYLSGWKIEFPPRAGRPVLMELVKKHLADGQPAF